MKYAVTIAYCLFSQLSACQECYETFDRLAREKRLDVDQEDENVYWKGYLYGVRYTFFYCRDIVRINHPDCKSD